MKSDACGPELKRRIGSLYFKEGKAELKLNQSQSHPLADYGTLKISAPFGSLEEGDCKANSPNPFDSHYPGKKKQPKPGINKVGKKPLPLSFTVAHLQPPPFPLGKAQHLFGLRPGGLVKVLYLRRWWWRWWRWW